jgi:hypothetical protein
VRSRSSRRAAGLLAAAAFGVFAAADSAAAPQRSPARPTFAGCAVLPANNPWNERVDRLPVAFGSARMIATIGLGARVHPDFGSGTYDGASIGIPITVVSSRRVPGARVRFTYASESDRGPYPIPRGVAIEGGRGSTGDRHAIVVDRSSCRDYELYGLYPPSGSSGVWRAGSGAVFSLRSNRLRPAGWTSADAAGLPILPGLARYAEVRAGAILHALRFTARCTAARFVYPARHFASTCRGASLPPMGLRVRLKANVDISRLPRQAHAVAVALKRYGLILADNGSPWYISGAPAAGWNNDDLHELDRLSGRDFEVVDTRSLPRPGL